MPRAARPFLLRPVALAPFVGLAAVGLFTLAGWWAGVPALVQPRLHDPALPANAALGFLLLGAAAVAAETGARRTAIALAAAVAALALLTIHDNLAQRTPGVDDLLAGHRRLVDAPGAGRIPLALGIVLAGAAVLVGWPAVRPATIRPARPPLLALAGSLIAAYAIAALFAARTGLHAQPAWQEHARLGALGAGLLLLLALGLLVLAARAAVPGTDPGRWLWMPVVAGGVTLSGLFWFALHERELVHLNASTRLTIDNLATLYAAELRARTENLRRMASRWTQSGGTPEDAWQHDASAQFNDFAAYRALMWVDTTHRTRWLYPIVGNEDLVSFDHSTEPARAAAMRAAHRHVEVAIAGPLATPLRSAYLAAYAPVTRDGQPDGFLVAEIHYDRLVGIVLRRLDLGRRYAFRVAVGDDDREDAPLRTIQETDSPTLDRAGRRVQTLTYRLPGQRLSIAAAPREDAAGPPGRQALPELALAAGLGVSLLLGLVVNLARAAHFRRRAAERTSAELRASQAATRMLSHVASRTGNPVAITSASGTIEWVNESFSRLTGRPAAEAPGVPLLDFLTNPDDDAQALERVTGALVRHEPITTDVVALSRDRERRYHLRLELQPVRNEAGETENFIALATDLTARVETEHALRRAKAEADAASRAKSDFLASMSHEIRTPMNGVIGMTSLLLETDLTAEQKDYVSTIRTSGDALLAIINEILDFSKIESGRMELERQPFELAQCLEEALDIFSVPAAAKGIELAYHLDPAVPPWIEGDMTRLRQVLVNLVNNAVKFTPGGSITVEVHVATVETAPGVHVAPAEAGGVRLNFLVADTGIGIPADRQHLLFRPFSQVDASTTRRFGGTGLGLAICERLCQLMGGSIDVTSRPGEGSTFRFSIQVRQAAALVEEVLPPIPQRLHGRPVLIMDDHAINRTILSRAVATLGFTPLGADNPDHAAGLAERHQLAAAVIDNVGEHGETGTTLAQQLRARHPKLPIVLYISPADGSRGAQGTDPFLARLTKPIKPALLRQVLAGLLQEPDAAETRPPMANDAGPRLAATIPLDILLVEDNPVNQKVALRFLDLLGYRADAAGNGVEAVRALQQRDYDLVLMDVQMPEMDGFTATREIRNKLPPARQPRIIALTANAVQGDRERCLQAGMDDYLSKPVKLEALELVIRRHFGPPEP